METEIVKSEFGSPNYPGSIIGRGFRVLNLNWAQKVSLLEMSLSTLQASDHHKNPNDKKTPEENMQLIRMYGGIQFPGTPLDVTPRHYLRHSEAEGARSVVAFASSIKPQSCERFKSL